MEVLVADDGSKDDTASVAESILDSRLSFVAHPVNRGACAVTNELIRAASGEFIAVMNSDDIWLSRDKLSYQVKLMRDNPSLGATFGRVNFINNQSDPIEKASLSFGSVFDQPNRSQGAWLRRFFYEGNCLCHPSVLIRKSCYSNLGLLDNRMRQLPDLDMWIRVLKAHPIHVSERPLVGFRILPGENASSQTRVNSIRTINEHFLIALSFFDNMSPELMKSAFSTDLIIPECPTTDHVKIEGALLLLKSEMPGLGPAYRLAGLIKLHEMLADSNMRAMLSAEYNVDDRWFQNRAGEYQFLRPEIVAQDFAKPARGATTNGSESQGNTPTLLRRMFNRFIARSSINSN